jgi:hypothetical protein
MSHGITNRRGRRGHGGIRVWEVFCVSPMIVKKAGENNVFITPFCLFLIPYSLLYVSNGRSIESQDEVNIGIHKVCIQLKPIFPEFTP